MLWLRRRSLERAKEEVRMLDQEAVGRLRRIAEVVRETLERGDDFDALFTTAYRWEHTQRVCQYGKLLAEAEGANLEWSLAGCLLHDIAHFEGGEGRDHGRLGAVLARPILEDVGYDPAAIDTICHTIAAHVDGDARDGRPDTIETGVVTDADNLDRFTTYRLLQWGAPRMKDFRDLCHGAEERLARLTQYRDSEPLETETGNRLFKEKLSAQIAFMKGLIEDAERTVLPWNSPA
jgi:HD superfamily phosphodiesterase